MGSGLLAAAKPPPSQFGASLEAHALALRNCKIDQQGGTKNIEKNEAATYVHGGRTTTNAAGGKKAR